MKVCSQCNESKPLQSFAKNRSRKDGHAGICKECQQIISKNHYGNNHDYYIQRNRGYRQKTADYLQRYKIGKKCACCPENTPCCLVFHHRDGDDKMFGISRGVTKKLSIASLEIEIAKCTLVCANCHAKIHAGLIVLPDAMSFNGRIRLFESLNVGSIPAIAIDSEGMRIGKRAVLNTVALTG